MEGFMSARNKRPIHQFLPLLSYGDAMSNHAIELMKLLRKWGHRSEIYVMDCDPRVARYCRHYTSYYDEASNVLIYQYGMRSSLTHFMAERLERVVLYYHNVTPGYFFVPIEPEVAASLECAREELRQLAGSVRLAVTVSEYNRRDLQALGFGRVVVLPLLFDLPALQRSADSRYGQDIVRRYRNGYLNILFVGRLAPNKRQDDLIRALVYYKRLIDPRVRLLLVGSSPSFRYRAYLEMLAEHLEVSDDVHFVGQVEMERGFGGYYKAADVFLCLSEHEGFCVPLVESMYCDLPVIAYASAAIPETMGESGLLITEKRYDLIGELVYLLANDETLRQQIISGQRSRVQAFRREIVEAQIRSWVETLDQHY
jgi:glycosyltransferase involved in cell wall biosynthesis